jgi:PAS domain S-box-containing protein
MERPGESRTGSSGVFHPESADRLRATIDLTPIGIAHLALDGRFILVNEHLCGVLGYEREELLERTLQGVTHPDDVTRCMALNAQLAVGRRSSYRAEFRLLRIEGAEVRCRLLVTAIPATHDAPACLVAIIIRRARPRLRG